MMLLGRALPDYAERAVITYEAMQRHLYLPSEKLYREAVGNAGDRRFSFQWPFVQALIATLCMAGLPQAGDRYWRDVEDRLTGLVRYWDSRGDPPAYASYVVDDGGGDRYYDDNLWVGLATVQLFRMRGDIDALYGSDRIPGAARAVFDFLVPGGWCATDDRCPGGVYWVEQGRGAGLQNHDRGTDSNAPGAELGYHLAELLPGDPNRPAWLDWAERLHGWLDRWLYDERTGLYCDKVCGDGTIDHGAWTYNQATPIGACVLRFRLTGDRSFLARARSVASATLGYFGEGRRLFTQPAAFNAFLVRRLLMLAAEDEHAVEWRVIHRYADEMWRIYRDPKTGLFRSDARQRRLIDQAGMVQIFACLAWPREQYRQLA